MIIGMISAFQTISIVGVGDPKALSGGISQALITTQTGLAGAIPLFIVHHILTEKADQLVMSLKQVTALFSPSPIQS